MPVDFTVASLPALALDKPAPLDWDGFIAMLPEGFEVPDLYGSNGSLRWRDLAVQLRNAMSDARGGRKRLPASGCDIYWRNRMAAAFAEKNPLKREDLIDRVWWDAAGELTSVSSPLSAGALETYAVRLAIVLKRERVSGDEGMRIFNNIISSAEAGTAGNQTTNTEKQ